MVLKIIEMWQYFTIFFRKYKRGHVYAPLCKTVRLLLHYSRSYEPFSCNVPGTPPLPRPWDILKSPPLVGFTAARNSSVYTLQGPSFFAVVTLAKSNQTRWGPSLWRRIRIEDLTSSNRFESNRLNSRLSHRTMDTITNWLPMKLQPTRLLQYKCILTRMM